MNSTQAATAFTPAEQELIGQTEQAMDGSGVEQAEVTADPDARIVPPQPEEPPFREVTIRVPAHVGDERVRMGLNIGADVLEGVTQGVAVIYFPHVAQKDGKPTQALGRAVVPLLSRKDVERLLKLAEVIGRENAKAVKRMEAEGQVGAIAASRDAETAKDNAARDLIAQAEGRSGGIIIARG